MKRQLAAVTRRLIPQAIQRKLLRAALILNAENVYPSLASTLYYLRGWGFAPSVVIDIGAFHGDWARQFHRIFPQSNILMIEAQNCKEEDLRAACAELAPGVEYEIALLGATDGQSVEFINMATGSSVFEEASACGRYGEARTTESLHSLVHKRHSNFLRPDFLKLDVQGYELEVLRGAGEVLQAAEFVLLEASLIPINKGCPLIGEVIAFMSAREFQLFDFCSQIRRKDGALWQTDLLFIAASSRFVPAAKLDNLNWPSGL